MFKQDFYHEIVRKIIIGFGTLFNEISILRTEPGESLPKKVPVPLVYAPKQKYLVRTVADLPQDKQVGIVYPRMSFMITSLQRDMDRKLVSTGLNYNRKNDEVFYTQYNPVPYDINIDLYIIGKNFNDVIQIVERILPYFLPQYNLNINLIPQMGIVRDVPVILNSTSFDDSFDGPFDERRSIVWTLQFTVKTDLYGKIGNQGLIRKVGVDFGVPEGDITDESMEETPRVARIIVDPDPIDAVPTDDYGYSITISEYNDGKKLDPSDGTDKPVEDL